MWRRRLLGGGSRCVWLQRRRQDFWITNALEKAKVRIIIGRFCNDTHPRVLVEVVESVPRVRLPEVSNEVALRHSQGRPLRLVAVRHESLQAIHRLVAVFAALRAARCQVHALVAPNDLAAIVTGILLDPCSLCVWLDLVAALFYELWETHSQGWRHGAQKQLGAAHGLLQEADHVDHVLLHQRAEIATCLDLVDKQEVFVAPREGGHRVVGVTRAETRGAETSHARQMRERLGGIVLPTEAELRS